MSDRRGGAAHASKGQYGLDAPVVIRNLIGIGLLLAGGSIAAFLFRGWVWLIVGAWLGLVSVFCLAEAVYMIWSSKRGKAIVVRKMLDMLQLRGDEHVLDVGCGRGFVLIAAARRLTGGRATGIDIWNSRDQSGNHPDIPLRNAERENVFDRITIVHADARQMPFEAHTFDVVVSSLALHNIPHEAERKRAIEEIARVLKPGGKVALLDFRYADAYARALTEAGFKEVAVSRRHLQMFPPVRIVTGLRS
ncbi:class I SAM-dependent methyltransferase [Cohnella sp. REN36]|uniref:class I SAM-dependent methyltransferase n=1 Tax=Cohnella sp. REN36 TaxID=2887347 RepID=UPI001D15CC2E|nr:class I SAM-dependent methyltransferase [Cohnella sp. REN36]